ncbi:MAG: undecaprenyl-phosphate alpha-N-acetylglucosaminyl 1-phosphate transferase [Gammaproteobacteria bacterium]|nr:MAG: undecaprenyl-phosphate alpha-N-acetylglucosaminyl 1-phosphate transferase [Gammaproteobacteria bacterium]
MLNLLPALLIAFSVSILTIKILLPLAPHIGLVDIPTARKKHNGAIPLIGGISIFTGVLIASTLFVDRSQILNLYLISSALIVFLGTLDDIYDLSVGSRIIFQGIVASIMVFGADIFISNLGSIAGGSPVDLGYFGIIFTILACLAAINAFNMVDGIDGLAGAMSIVTIGSIASLNLFAGQLDLIILPLVIVVAILPFFFYNVSRRNPRGKKIFMGDAGSMFMGLTVIWLLTLNTQGESASFRPVTALWIISIPLIDMIAIMIRRLIAGNSPFKADNGHLHHTLLQAGFSSRKALVTITLLSLSISIIGISLEMLKVPAWISLNLFIAVFIAYLIIISGYWKRQEALSCKTSNKTF